MLCMTKFQPKSSLRPQVGIIDKSCLVEKVSKLPPSIMILVSKALSDLLDL